MIKKSIIEAKFKRNNSGFTHTFLWLNLTEEHKKEFNWISLSPNEDIILCYKQDKTIS